MRNVQTLSVAATGVTVTTTISTSANGTVPLTSANTKARYLRFVATGTAYVRLAPAVGSAVAVTTDAMVLPGSPLILEVAGATHYAVIDDGVSVKVNITPLEDN